MPRTARAAPAGQFFHVLNRGNAGMTVFHDATDFADFAGLLAEAGARAPVSLFAWCLMPNHFHLLLRPDAEGALARWMQWLMTVQVRRHRARHAVAGQAMGHLWQGRFKAFPVAEDEHLLTVARYVERNPVRAGLARAAADWPWSSAKQRLGQRPTQAGPTQAGPTKAGSTRARRRRSAASKGPEVTHPMVPELAYLALPAGWDTALAEPEPAAALDRLRRCVNKGTPFGPEPWIADTATRLGLEATLRGPGRPKRSDTAG